MEATLKTIAPSVRPPSTRLNRFMLGPLFLRTGDHVGQSSPAPLKFLPGFCAPLVGLLGLVQPLPTGWSGRCWRRRPAGVLQTHLAGTLA